ncbi:MAG: efflux RND transporter periplasmic adaptor subunit [Chitinophagaceae bacterium]|nr:MAG: efflux RND transporter periplasmic adaptor subunit [Chitinophagaceae bacterium]
MKYYFATIVSASILLGCAEKKKETTAKAAEKITPAAYETTVVETGGVATLIKLPAQLAAWQEVSIFPKVNGYVKTVSVDVGSLVGAGQNLMSLEAPELEQAATQAKEKYARTKADYAIDREHYQRLLEAAKTAGAVSTLDISTYKAKMEADSAVSNAEKANWQMQQTMLGYLRVTAPFAGVITERNVHPGALVSTAGKEKPMLELKQVNHLRLQVDVPEAVAAAIQKQDTVYFYVSALQGERLSGFISRRSKNINAQYRSERMEIDVPNPKGKLAPGMYADVVLHSKGNAAALLVPATAVVTSTERKYVLVIRDGKISKVDVSTGNQTASKTEIFGNLKAGEKVVLKATDEIRETL